MTASSTIGSHTTPAPAPVFPSVGGPWALWKTLAEGRPAFGDPSNFDSRVGESNWESFTVTLRTPEFLDKLTEWSGNQPGTGGAFVFQCLGTRRADGASGIAALVTFKDSNWLLSIVVPHQPHFLGQPENVQVFWGYSLFTDRVGDFVKVRFSSSPSLLLANTGSQKTMTECTGEEIMTELLGHLNFPLSLASNATCITTMLPYITSQFLTRTHASRPPVLSPSRPNLAFLGQFVEIPEDVVFTVEYSVRAAQTAVFEMMGLERKPKAIYKGERDLHVLVDALKALLS